VLIALPQALAYMLNDPNPNQLMVFACQWSGVCFIKLIQQNQPQYARSYALSIEREDELYQVLSVLKRLGQLDDRN